MAERLRDTYALIKLQNVTYNVDVIYNKIKKPLIAVIKADAYGHGHKQVAQVLNEHPHIAMFAVATLEEAMELRKQGIKKDIIVLGAIPVNHVELAAQYDITLAMISKDYLLHIQKIIKTPVKVHIAIDTGMNRIGLKSKEELDECLSLVDSSKVIVEGAFTHFCTADAPHDVFSNEAYRQQLALFKEIIGSHSFKYIHCDNTAAMMYHDSNFGMMGRIGIALYGNDPSGEENKELKQVMSLYTQVVMIKEVKKGEKIGYGMTYTVPKDTKIATLPIGYADGFIRKNQGRKVYINGRYYPIVGRVCMDQCMIEVDDHVKLYDQVEIFGEHISLSQMAKELDTISYEITCLITSRVEREYEN